MQNPARWLVLASALLATTPHAESIRLPEMGSGSTVITPSEERAAGRDVVRKLRRAGLLVQDPRAEAYLKELGQRLTAAASTEATFHFFLVDDEAINAFALPGGYIGINTGLVLSARSESELASVIAHEIAHVTQQHIARSIEQLNKMNAPLTAALIAAIALGSQSPELAQAAIATTLAGTTQSRLDFSRQYEQEADRVGMQTLTEGGFDPHGMPAFFERLYQESRFSGAEAAELEFLRTHPVTLSRIADAKGRAVQLSTEKPPRDDAAFNLLKAELRVRTATEPQLLAQRLKDGSEAVAMGDHARQYARLLALIKANRLNEAESMLSSLDGIPMLRPRLFQARAAIVRARNDLTTAENILRQATHIYPGDAALVHERARTLLALQRFEEAVTLLRAFARDHADAAEAYLLLSEAENARGHTGPARLARAEHYLILDEISLAIDQLQQAKRDTRLDEYDLARVEARLAQLLGDRP